jgi:branched-chain amino acid transport system permease protein
LLILPQVVGSFPSEIIGVVGLYVLLGIGLNIVVGFAGMLDLGYVAFYAVGAYSVGILTSPASPLFAPQLSFWVALPIVLVITTIAGILIGAPVLRLRGDYLAIVTLGFGEMIRVIVQSDWASPMLGGAQGLLRVPAPPFFGGELRDPQAIYYLILACVLLVAFVAYRVKSSRIGRAWNAMREDEQVAESMGISIIKTKLLAFGLGAALASFGGMIFAAKIGSLFPNTFLLIVSINVLAIIVLGGMGSIPGVVVGAFVLVGIPEVLREFGEYRLLFYGLLLMVIMILRPEGVLPDVRRKRELHEAELEDEVLLAAAAVGGGALPGGARS